MKTTVIWSHLLGAKVALHIHHRGTLAGRYIVSRLWPGEDTGGWACVALWPVSDSYAGEWPTVRLDAEGAPVVEAAHELALRVIGVAREAGRAYVPDVAREVAA